MPLSPAEKSDQQTHSLTHSLTLLTRTHFTVVHNLAQASQHNTHNEAALLSCLLNDAVQRMVGWLTSAARHGIARLSRKALLHWLHRLHRLQCTAQWWIHINNTFWAMYISSPLSSSVPNDSSSLDIALSSLLPIILRVSSAVQCSAVQVA